MIAVWGANGFIGSRIAASGDYIPVIKGIFPPGHKLPDNITGVIWCAGWPGRTNISDVQSTPYQSRLQNVWEPLELAHRCALQGIRFLVMSSGCLYDGLNPEGHPWKEDETPNFVTPVYHRDKWEMERLLKDFGPTVTIFRFRLPFDSSHHPRNMIQKFSRWESVMDIWQSFTSIVDLVRATHAWERGDIDGGTWHVTQPGALNNYLAVKNHLNPEVTILPEEDRRILHDVCPRSAAILDSSKLNSVILLQPAEQAWKNACREFLA